VVRLLQNREDIFEGYTSEGFESNMGIFFIVLEKYPVKDSVRTLYVLRPK